MLKDIINVDFFKVYHPGSKSLTGSVTIGPGNDPVALAIGGVTLLVIIFVVLYIRKKYKQKYNY